MLAVFTAPDALVVAAVVAAAGSSVAAWITSAKTARQMRPNGGSSIRDALDRIESKVDHHGERLAVLEAAHNVAHRPPNTRTRKGDTRHAA